MTSSSAPVLLLLSIAAIVLSSVPARAQFAQNYATPYAITTLAGTTSNGTEDGTDARLCQPNAVSVDAAGNLYIADTANHTIRKRTTNGNVTTLAGLATAIGSVDGAGAAARFYEPAGVAVDLNGNVYVADRSNHVIRKITPGGVVTTLAGLAGNQGSTDGVGAAARFRFPRAVAVDAAGNIYVADSWNHTVRKITPLGGVTTLAGAPGQYGHADGAAARFNRPEGVAVDAAGYVYVADYFNQCIRKISPAGETSTLAGQVPMAGHIDGTGSAARFTAPNGITVDAAGNLFVTSMSDTVRKVTPNGTVTTLAGAMEIPGSNDGTGLAARFLNPKGLVVDGTGNLYVADAGNNTLRRIAPDQTVTTIVGLSEQASLGYADGTGRNARFSKLTDIAVDAAGNLYVPDQDNSCIRKITPSGVVTTFAGSPGNIGATDGSLAQATFFSPRGIAIDAAGNIYVSEYYINTIRKITPGGTVSTLAGIEGQPAFADGVGAAARFNRPAGLDVDAAGNVYVMDYGNNAVRKITPAGVVSTVVTSSQYGYPVLLEYASHLAVDPAGNVFICDSVTNTIRKFSTDGILSIVAGSGYINGWNDGTGTGARFNYPIGIAIDPAGNLFVTEESSKLVRRISPAGVVTTVVGALHIDSRKDGVGERSGLDAPFGATTDDAGNIYITDAGSVRKIQPAAVPAITSQPQNQSVTVGGSVQFSVTAAGVPDPAYQWYLNGQPYAGATGRTLSFSNARTADAGDYTVVVTNDLGSVASNRATLTVSSGSSPQTPGGGGGSGGGGGGSHSLGFLLALLLSAGMRFRRSRDG